MDDAQSDPTGLFTFTNGRLFRIYADLLDEFLRRGLARSGNSIISDHAEQLFCRAFGWTLAPRSAKSIDAIGEDGVGVQIKARRLVGHLGDRELGALRGLDEKRFDMLGAILFRKDFSVHRAALIPYDIVKARATRSSHTNSWKFQLKDMLWELEGVRDVTPQLQSVQQRWLIEAQ